MAQTAQAKAVPEEYSISLSSIYPNPEQARKIFDAAKLHELAASIREQGLMNPIVVRPDDDGKFMIIAGERRYRACTLLNLEKVPVLVRDISDESLTVWLLILMVYLTMS